METNTKHTPEMTKIIETYNKSIDTTILDFVNDVESERDVLPITVGFINERMAEEIYKLTGLSVENNRIGIGADDIRHILKRHGKNGKADHSMEDIKDIARLSYVLANYDSVEWDGGLSSQYRLRDGSKAPQITIKKRVNGTYYVIEVVSDSKQKRNVVTTIYLKKATE